MVLAGRAHTVGGYGADQSAPNSAQLAFCIHKIFSITIIMVIIVKLVNFLSSFLVMIDFFLIRISESVNLGFFALFGEKSNEGGDSVHLW